MFVLQTLVLILLSLLVISIPESRRMRLLLTFLLSFFLTAQLSSVYFGGSFVDYKFYMHILTTRQDILSEQFVVPAILFGLLFFVFFTLLYFPSSYIKNLFLNHSKIRLVAILAFFIVLCFPGGMIRKIIDVGAMLVSPNKEFLESLNELGIDSTNYTFPDQISAEKGQNLVVILLESMEKGWLEEPFSQLTPNLNRLANDWNFIPMTEREVSDFTSAAIYTMMSGIPGFFRKPGIPKIYRFYRNQDDPYRPCF